jgi:hypothetical protein
LAACKVAESFTAAATLDEPMPVDEPVAPGGAELLDEWPVPENWLERVNAADTAGELEALRRWVRRGRPYGEEEWVMRTAEKLDLGASLRPRGRPRKRAKPPLD